MTGQSEKLRDLLGRTERLCRHVADSIDGNAQHGNEKHKLLAMADEAADLQVKLDPQDPHAVVVNLETLAEALR